MDHFLASIHHWHIFMHLYSSAWTAAPRQVGSWSSLCSCCSENPVSASPGFHWKIVNWLHPPPASLRPESSCGCPRSRWTSSSGSWRKVVEQSRWSRQPPRRRRPSTFCQSSQTTTNQGQIPTLLTSADSTKAKDDDCRGAQQGQQPKMVTLQTFKYYWSRIAEGWKMFWHLPDSH